MLSLDGDLNACHTCKVFCLNADKSPKHLRLLFRALNRRSLFYLSEFKLMCRIDLFRVKKGWTSAILFAVYSLISPHTAFGESGGINGYSGQSGPTVICSSCHNNTGTLWTATPTIDDIDTTQITTDPNNSSIYLVVPGSTGNSFRVNATSANSVRVGVDLSVTGGTLVDATSIGHIENSELTHDSPQIPSNALWNFNWTAPSTVGTYTFYWCNNLVDFNGVQFDGSSNRDNPVCRTQQVKVNTSPNAVNDSFNSIDEDSADICLSVLANDTSGTSGDETGDSIILFSVGTPNNGGSATLGGGSCTSSQIRYTPAANFDGTETITYTVRDSFNQSGFADSATVTVNIVAQNDNPALSGVDATPIYVEATNPGVIIDSSVTVSDIDSNCNQATIDLSVGYQSTEDLLEYTGSVSGISAGAFNTSTGTLTLSGTAACSDYATALENVRYRNTSLNPNTATRTVVFQVRDSGNALSNTDSTTVTVQDVSTPPTLSGVDGTVNYIEDTSPGVIIDSDIAVTDPDSPNCNQATIDFSTGYQSGEDLLEYTGLVTGISAGTFNAATGTLTLVGTVACADYAIALENVRYRNTSQSPVTTSRTVEFQVSDSGNSLSNTDAKTISVTATNDAPVAVNDNFSVPVNSADNQLDPLSNDSDPDIGDTLMIVAVGAPDKGGSVVIGTPCAANTLCYTPVADFTETETFTYTIEDGSSAQDTATITISGTDTDGDGVIDFLDNCPNDANASQEDNDNDGEGDICDDDDDNDGMPDTFENTHGLDPFDTSDANEDADGDGRTNLEEFQAGGNPKVDDVSPEFGDVQDITIDATGYFTPVMLGVVTANDVADGNRTVSIQNVVGTTSQANVGKWLFRPGHTVIAYSATDASGNNSTLDQTVDVRPLANLLPNQVAVEGGVVTIGVRLNGEAPAYPVTFDYTVSGTAGSMDHDAVDGSLSIASGTGGELVVNLVDDGVVEGSETLVITLSNPQNAALGNKTRHTVVINEGNMAPAVTLTVAQATHTGPLVTADGGTVTVTAAVSDLNTGDTFTFDWSQSSSFLMAINGTGGSGSNTFEFDPTGLSAGVYPVIVSVTDSGSPAATKSTRLVLNLKASAPVLAAVDSDGDGVNDDVEGYQDADGNGIADYLDPYNSATGTNLIPNQTGQLQKTLLLQTDTGLKLRMGEAGLNADATGALVSRGNIETYVNQSGGSPNLTKDTYRNVGGIFDFEVYGLPVGESADVVIPLSAGILVDAVYRKFELQNGWQMFVYNTNNSIRSAKSVNGVCPAPGHASYAVGLAEFNDCVQLTIQDGGPNDADGVADGVIRDPGGVAVADVTPEHVTSTPDDGSGGGGGSLHPVWLLLGLSGWLLALARHRKRK